VTFSLVHRTYRLSAVLRTIVLFALASVVSCGRESGSASTREADEPVLVFAASDLRDALAELARRYRTDGGDSIVLVFGSTGDLVTQIINGAPADIFFAANAKAIDDLAERGRVIDSTRAIYAIGRLAVVASCAPALRDSMPSACPTITLPELANPQIRKVAIADPAHAPYGLAARQALERSNLWTRVQPRIVMGANISQAEQFVATGNADAGLISLSLLKRTPGRVYTLVDSALHDPLRQTVAVMSSSRRVNAAVRFLSFMSTELARSIMLNYGLNPPTADSTGVPMQR
jgi:molybdate transport system substrate-binding protein